MARKYKLSDKKTYQKHDPKTLREAIKAIQEGKTLRKAAQNSVSTASFSTGISIKEYHLSPKEDSVCFRRLRKNLLSRIC